MPRRVYWFRRLLVLGIAFALVLGIAKLLDYSTGGSGGERAASVAAAPEATSTDSATPVRRKDRPAKDRRTRGKDQKDRLARPTGPCADSDVLVTPTVADAHAGGPVEIVLEVTTVETPACYFDVGPDSVFVNIDGENGTLWSSQHCPDAVPTETVVARRERAATVTMWWNGKESEEGCPTWSPWVDVLGGYTAVAAVRGSVTPVAIGFFLGGAVAPTVTRTATPSPTPSEDPQDERPGERPGERSSTSQGSDRR